MTREEMLNECVSRDKAIVQLNHLKSDWDDDWNIAIRKCVETIKIVPSVTAKPKMGKWRKVSMDKYVQHATYYYECSECKGQIIGEYNYCPYCGSKNGGAE